MSNLCSKSWQDYEVLGVLGNGAFGTCYKVRDKASGQIYAWKGMSYDEDLSEKQQESLISEIQVLRQLHHPNIVQYHHHLVNHEARSLYIVMEYCEGGDLSQLIAQARRQRRRFEESYIWRVLFQMCRALQVCHNKIQAGTILHRDIKPANIFLDAKGNVKLGDFGLARMMQRHESFAETFVGTPYYMSPEIVRGSKYDRKSDVWALGCLTYELCALKPPFSGQEFQQLSSRITRGKFAGLPPIYSEDLSFIVAYMLEVDSDQRPSVEIVARHPIVVRNIMHLGKEFPRLLLMEQDEDVELPQPTPNSTPQKLKGSEYRSLYSSCQELGFLAKTPPVFRRLSISDVSCRTPELKAELFYSARRRIFGDPLQRKQSDPAIYESIQHERHNGQMVAHVPPVPHRPPHRSKSTVSRTSPTQLTKDIFEQALQERLQNIRAHESLLRLKEESLNVRERQLNERERRLLEREKQISENEQREKQLPGDSSSQGNDAPPRPPKKPTAARLDDTYCSIDPLENSPRQGPTVAKMDLNTLTAAAKIIPQARRVTFQSPKRFITYSIEGDCGQPERMVGPTMQSSTSSKDSENSAEFNSGKKRPHNKSNNGTSQRRKSIFSILGLNRLNNNNNNNNNSKDNKDHHHNASAAQKNPEPLSVPLAERKDHCLVNVNVKEGVPIKIDPACILAKCETTELSNIWTEEHKRAAFQMLAALNASGSEMTATSVIPPRQRTRQSVRERNSLQRNRLRRSLVAATTPIVAAPADVIPRARLVASKSVI